MKWRIDVSEPTHPEDIDLSQFRLAGSINYVARTHISLTPARCHLICLQIRYTKIINLQYKSDYIEEAIYSFLYFRMRCAAVVVRLDRTKLKCGNPQYEY